MNKNQFAPITSAEVLTDQQKQFDVIQLQIYRTECRAWMLWFVLSMITIGYMELMYKAAPAWVFFCLIMLAVIYAGLMSFWVIYPLRLVLKTISRASDTLRHTQDRQKFDDSWASIVDIGVPTLATITGALVLLLLQVFFLAR